MSFDIAGDFQSSATIKARGAGLSAFFGSILLLPLVLLVPVFGPFLAFALVAVGICGLVGGAREGSCPHCGEKITIWYFQKNGNKCKACAHRLSLRGDRIVDLSSERSIDTRTFDEITTSGSPDVSQQRRAASNTDTHAGLPKGPASSSRLITVAVIFAVLFGLYLVSGHGSREVTIDKAGDYEFGIELPHKTREMMRTEALHKGDRLIMRDADCNNDACMLRKVYETDSGVLGHQSLTYVYMKVPRSTFHLDPH